MKSGKRTTEYWLTLLFLASSTLAMAAVLYRVNCYCSEGTLTHALGLVTKLITDAVIVAHYIGARTEAKTVYECGPYPPAPMTPPEEWPHGEPPW